MSAVAAAAPTVLAEAEWLARQWAHEQRVDKLVAGHLARRRHGQKHPVEDFLFSYYGFRPAQLRRWHPGAGVVLAGDVPDAGRRGYERTAAGVTLSGAFVNDRAQSIRRVHGLLAATASRPAFIGCFGLHEWAMVYRADTVRHKAWPLRLGRDDTDAVVEAHQIRCSHFDAFRFFTDDATPRNTLRPSPDRRHELEQPGCLHANMDLYKYAAHLSPLIPSELIVDCFELAREIRAVDMRASPYDLTALGYQPIKIETVEGKRQYVEAQRSFSRRAAPLRSRLIADCDRLLALIDELDSRSCPGRPAI